MHKPHHVERKGTTVENSDAKAKPFLKWAGGKGSLIHTLSEFVPASFSRYIEPFVGGGAFFFSLAPERAILGDSNSELINAYTVVRDNPAELMATLGTYRNTKDEFYRIRALNTDELSPVDRAARFIYLNKTCFNGLYRVNRQGEFNTPYGNNPRARFFDEENLLLVSKRLRNVTLMCSDFDSVLRKAKKGDFVYLDPPYMPISEFSDFKRYTANQFREPEQMRLAQTFKALHEKGCFLLLSNSDHPKILDWYAGFKAVTVNAPRFINCLGDRRGHVKELLITNF